MPLRVCETTLRAMLWYSKITIGSILKVHDQPSAVAITRWRRVQSEYCEALG